MYHWIQPHSVFFYQDESKVSVTCWNFKRKYTTSLPHFLLNRTAIIMVKHNLTVICCNNPEFYLPAASRFPDNAFLPHLLSRCQVNVLNVFARLFLWRNFPYKSILQTVREATSPRKAFQFQNIPNRCYLITTFQFLLVCGYHPNRLFVYSKVIYLTPSTHICPFL